jgi:hypothetical protein
METPKKAKNPKNKLYYPNNLYLKYKIQTDLARNTIKTNTTPSTTKTATNQQETNRKTESTTTPYNVPRLDFVDHESNKTYQTNALYQQSTTSTTQFLISPFSISQNTKLIVSDSHARLSTNNNSFEQPSIGQDRVQNRTIEIKSIDENLVEKHFVDISSASAMSSEAVAKAIQTNQFLVFKLTVLIINIFLTN